jgi:hypothetical protein
LAGFDCTVHWAGAFWWIKALLFGETLKMSQPAAWSSDHTTIIMPRKMKWSEILNQNDWFFAHNNQFSAKKIKFWAIYQEKKLKTKIHFVACNGVFLHSSSDGGTDSLRNGASNFSVDPRDLVSMCLDRLPDAEFEIRCEWRKSLIAISLQVK